MKHRGWNLMPGRHSSVSIISNAADVPSAPKGSDSHAIRPDPFIQILWGSKEAIASAPGKASRSGRSGHRYSV
jgi:hypothetical protein